MKHLAANTALVVATLAAVWVLWELREAVVIFFLSLGAAAALRPAIDGLVARRWPKPAALAITYASGVLLAVGLVAGLAFPLSRDTRDLAKHTAEAYRDISDTWPQGTAWQKALVERLPTLEELERMVLGRGVDNVASLLGFTLGLFSTAVHLVVILVLSLYWSIDRVHFERLWLSLLAVEHRRRARETWRDIEIETGGYLRREVGQSLAAGLLLGLGFAAIGQPYPVLSAAIGALLWLIPWVGALFAMLAVMSLSLPVVILEGTESGLVSLVTSAGFTLIVLVLLEVFVRPRLFRQERYNPILLALVAVGLAEWLGILGLLVAPPLATAIQILARQLLERRSAAGALPANSADIDQRLAVLHARLAEADDVPDEVKSLAERLDALVAEGSAVLKSRAEGGAPA